MQLVGAAVWIALGVLLFALAPKVRASVVSIVGAVVLLAGVSVFAVRLHHAGPYPFPGPVDFVSGCVALGVGLVLLLRSPQGLAKRVLLGVAPFVFLLAVVAMGHEAEEVVVLRTTRDDGGLRETRLWVVDHEGSPWVVTGRGSGHDDDVGARPRVEIFRRGEARCWVAERHLDRETIATVLHRRSEQYVAQRVALASRVWEGIEERDDLEEIAVAIRFEPCVP